VAPLVKWVHGKIGQQSSLLPFWDKLYLTVQLFTLDSGNLGSGAGQAPIAVPLSLQVARFLAPGIHTDRVRRSGCAPSRTSGLASSAFRAEGKRVVAIERDPQNAFIGECRDAGAIVLIGDCMDRSLLRRAGIHKARSVVAVSGG
jgi:TrkA-N domain